MLQARTGSHASQRHQSLYARGGGLRRLIVGVALAGVAAVGQPAAGQGLEELRVRYPDVKAYHPHGRVLTVWGTPMTRGETPREAADEWVFWHGDVFGSTLDLAEFRDVKLRRAPEGKERRVFMYRQTMDIEGRAEPVAVVGSSFRVMTEGEPDSGEADVVYVAGRVATRPMGGLPAPVVTPAEALAAAKGHERGRGLETWSEPELVAIYDDAPRGDGVAQAAWLLRGAGESVFESHTFYVDAIEGVVVRHHSSIAHFAGEIQGTVTGYATPGTRPDPFAETGSECLNPESDLELPDVRVVAYREGTQQVADSTFTDASGDFSLDISQSAFPVEVFAELRGPAGSSTTCTRGARWAGWGFRWIRWPMEAILSPQPRQASAFSSTRCRRSDGRRS